MNDKNLPPENDNDGENSYTGRIYCYIAIGLLGLAALFLGLTFVIGVYSLVASMLLCIAAMTFINIQKRKFNFGWLKFVNVAAYVLFIACMLLFLGGTIWSGIN